MVSQMRHGPRWMSGHLPFWEWKGTLARAPAVWAMILVALVVGGLCGICVVP
jgi:hypothetical protein